MMMPFKLSVYSDITAIKLCSQLFTGSIIVEMYHSRKLVVHLLPCKHFSYDCSYSLGFCLQREQDEECLQQGK